MGSGAGDWALEPGGLGWGVGHGVSGLGAERRQLKTGDRGSEAGAWAPRYRKRGMRTVDWVPQTLGVELETAD